MRLPTMWYVKTAKAQTSLHICAVCQSLYQSLEYSMSVKLLTEHHLELLSLKGGWIGLYESTLVKMPCCWKSHVTAHFGVNMRKPEFVSCKQQSRSAYTSTPLFETLWKVYRESYMSSHVLLNLLNDLGKRDKMGGLPSISSLFPNEFNKFNNTRA